jgi:hypothetical protein
MHCPQLHYQRGCTGHFAESYSGRNDTNDTIAGTRQSCCHSSKSCSFVRGRLAFPLACSASSPIAIAYYGAVIERRCACQSHYGAVGRHKPERGSSERTGWRRQDA